MKVSKAKEIEMKLNIDNMELFVDNDYVQIQNKSDKKQLRDMEDEHRDDIYSDIENENKTRFYALDEKINKETVQIDYRYTSDLLEELFKKLELPIKITPA